jgi:hypothetical protein
MNSHTKTGAAAALDKIATMPAAQADKLIECLRDDAMSAALEARRQAGA